MTRAYINPQGHATFESHGEHLFACDDLPEGSTVWAEAMWDHEIRGVVTDTNGAGGGCGEENLSIPDGKDVNIRACAGGYCSEWVDSEA